jgi:PPOX class probable F420-dependent enzyme
MAAKLDEKTREFLEAPNVGVLATISRRGRLQATPVWFVLEDEQILINTSKGRVKLKNLEAHPYAALTIVNPQNIYHYVQIQGKVVRTDTRNGAKDIDRLSRRYTGRAYPYYGGDRPEDRVSIYIEPLAVDGMGPG